MSENKIILWNLKTFQNRQQQKKFVYSTNKYDNLFRFIKILLENPEIDIIRIEIDLNEYVIEVITN